MNKYTERIYNGVVKENPTFIMMLGMCPTLAVTTSAINGFGMGVSTLAVLILSNLIISALRKVIPDQVRLPAYIVIVASLVTVIQLLIQAYIPFLYDALGIYIPLIVVNCIILGRAEAYAAKNPPLLSVMDGLGMGLGFTLALTLIGIVRELFGAGTLFGVQVMPGFYEPVAILTKAPGAFLVLAIIIAIMNGAQIDTAANDKVESCDGCCATCGQPCATPKQETAETKEGETV
ncbi:MAG: electron transport complex subunit E [Clostridiales bacterium]|nr:electron transport complex subunit E [Clostridiales bacterium]